MSYYLQEDGTSKFLLEDGSGFYLLETSGGSFVAANPTVALARSRPRRTGTKLSPPTVVTGASAAPVVTKQPTVAFVRTRRRATIHTLRPPATVGTRPPVLVAISVTLARIRPPHTRPKAASPPTVISGPIPPSPTPPTASFTYSVSGLTVTFTNTSTPGTSGMFASFLWDFGDGTTDASTWSPSHTYASPGTYAVTLTVTGAAGDGTSSVRPAVTTFIPSAVGIHIDGVAV